jgi:hypothetical protein
LPGSGVGGIRIIIILQQNVRPVLAAAASSSSSFNTRLVLAAAASSSSFDPSLTFVDLVRPAAWSRFGIGENGHQ